MTRRPAGIATSSDYDPGNIPHDDPVTVTDKLTGIGDAPILSLTAASGADPFPCSPPPTQAPFTCTGHMRLEVGEHNKYEVVIRIPEDAPNSGDFTNCAGVGKDAAEATPGSTDDVCHTTKLEPASPEENCPEGWAGKYPNCTPPQVSGGPSATQDPVQNALDPSGGSSPTGENACFGGMILVSAGECRCPAPTILNVSTGTCVAAPACPEGYEGEYPYCRLSPPTGGMSTTADSKSVKERREAGGPTGGSSATADSQSTKVRRERGEPRPRRHREPKPPPTGGMSSTMQVPTGTKNCHGIRVPISFNCPPKRIGKGKPAPQQAGPTGGMNATGQPAGDKQRFKTTTGIQGAPPQPDKRINYGSSSNDNKPAGKPIRAVGKCRSGTSYDVVQKRCTPNVNVRWTGLTR